MIDQFTGSYAILSNFFRIPIAFDGDIYPTLEHAFAAAKTLDPQLRAWIREAPTPSAAKRRGRTVPLRADWDAMRIAVMRDLLHEKFPAGSWSARALLATGGTPLIEGNSWGDTFWGVCRGIGENHLGRLLMERRDALRSPSRP